MRRYLVFAALVSGLVVVLAACTTVNFGTNDGKLRYDLEEPAYNVVGHFEITVSDPTLIAGLVRLSDQDQNTNRFFQEQIQKYGGKAVRNVNLKYGLGVLDFVLSALTWQIYSPRTITVSGDVIK